MIKPSKDCSNFFKVMITAGLLFLPTIGSSDVIINNGTSDGCDTINGVMEQGCTPEGEVIPTQTEPNEPTTPTGPGGNTGGDVIIDNGVSDGCDIINGVMEQGCTPEGEVIPTTEEGPATGGGEAPGAGAGAETDSGQQPPATGTGTGSGQQPPATGTGTDSGQQPPATGTGTGSGQQPPATGTGTGSGQQPPATGIDDSRGASYDDSSNELFLPLVTYNGVKFQAILENIGGFGELVFTVKEAIPTTGTEGGGAAGEAVFDDNTNQLSIPRINYKGVGYKVTLENIGLFFVPGVLQFVVVESIPEN